MFYTCTIYVYIICIACARIIYLSGLICLPSIDIFICHSKSDATWNWSNVTRIVYTTLPFTAALHSPVTRLGLQKEIVLLWCNVHDEWHWLICIHMISVLFFVDSEALTQSRDVMTTVAYSENCMYDIRKYSRSVLRVSIESCRYFHT